MDIQRYEVRKVELFIDGSFGYASKEHSKGKTEISDLTFPMLQDLSIDGELQPVEIDKKEFEIIWRKAVSNLNI